MTQINFNLKLRLIGNLLITVPINDGTYNKSDKCDKDIKEYVNTDSDQFTGAQLSVTANRNKENKVHRTND